MTSHHKVDFLKSGRYFSRREQPAARGARLALRVALVIFGVLVLLALPFGYAAAMIAVDAGRGRGALQSAQYAAGMLDFSAAGKDAARAHDAFLDAHDRLTILKPFAWLPPVRPSIEALDGLLSSGIAASAAAIDLFEVADEIVAAASATDGITGTLEPLPDPSVIFKNLTVEEKRGILAALQSSGPRLVEADARIVEALAAFDRIPASELDGPFGDVLRPLRPKLALAHETLSALAPLSAVAPALFGYPAEKSYLFFFQNDTELRPTGGFLGVFGAVTVKDAGITSMRTNDIYSLDGPSEKSPRPAAPAPIAKYIGVSKWYLRDANWSPDFPTSAATMEKFYREEAAVVAKAAGQKDAAVPPMDGVIAITTKFAEDVMRLSGPVTVDDITFTADNLVEELQYQVEQGFAREGIAFHERKNIVGDLVNAVSGKLMALPLSRLEEVLEIVERNFAEGHILVSAKDETLAREITMHDWGGALRPVLGDYLHYVDANLAALKTDQVMERSLQYTISPKGDGYEGSVKMTYHNKGSFTWKTTRYRTYARLYVPAGTELLEVRGAMENDKIKDPARRPGKADVYNELGRRAFGAFIAVEPGETKTLEFRFRLAPSVIADIRSGKYSLDFEKQLGTEAHRLTLDLDIGKNLSDATPAEDRKEWGDSRYRMSTDLRIDRAFDLKF
jgi:hypothetical protein